MTHYEVLDVATDANTEAIKAAFRQKVKECHPDKGGDPEAFQRLFTAYEVLRDPKSRIAYDHNPMSIMGTSLGMFDEPPANAEERLVYDAMTQWANIRRHRKLSWDQWMLIGGALLKGREWAKEFAGARDAHGAGYQRAYRLWLLANGLDWWAEFEMKDVRSHLLSIMERRAEVEAWLEGLPEDERIKLTHPTMIWRRFNSVRPAPWEKKKPQSGKPTYKQLEDENVQLTLHIAELDARIAELKEENEVLRGQREEAKGGHQ